MRTALLRVLAALAIVAVLIIGAVFVITNTTSPTTKKKINDNSACR